MKIKIVSACQGGTPLQHLRGGAVVDLDVANAQKVDAAHLYATTARELLREGAGRLVDEADLPRLVQLLPDGRRPRALATR